MSSPTMDKTQRQLMLVLPLFFVIFIINFPAGLIVYWITTNLWTIGQQYVGATDDRASATGRPVTATGDGGRRRWRRHAAEAAWPERRVADGPRRPRRTAPRRTSEGRRWRADRGQLRQGRRRQRSAVAAGARRPHRRRRARRRSAPDAGGSDGGNDDRGRRARPGAARADRVGRPESSARSTWRRTRRA